MEIEKLKSLIESCHLNFLIGSGASRNHLGTLGLIEPLLTDLAESTYDEDVKTVLDATIKHHYFEIAIKGNLEIFTGTSDELTKTKKAYRDFINNVNTFLKRRKSNLLSKQANLFTTNMDLFLEYTLEASNTIYNDGFAGRLNSKFGTENFHNSIFKTSAHYDIRSELPSFNLFKLHGSLNWIEASSDITYDYESKLLNAINGIERTADDFVSIFKDAEKSEIYTIEEIHAQLTSHNIERKAVHFEFLEAYNNLVMINPTKDKFATTTKNLLFYELLRMYSNHLERENSVLFVFGFSFADEHIREITKRVALSNPTLLILIFAFNQSSKQSIESLLGNSNNIEIIAPNEGDDGYSLQKINNLFFNQVSNLIEGIVKPKKEAQEVTQELPHE